jgi:hypothetical protein
VLKITNIDLTNIRTISLKKTKIIIVPHLEDSLLLAPPARYVDHGFFRFDYCGVGNDSGYQE